MMNLTELLKSFWSWFYLAAFTGFGVRAAACALLFLSIYFLVFTRKTGLALFLSAVSFVLTYLLWIPGFLISLFKNLLTRLWL